MTTTIDVLCIGYASFDLVFSVARHPAPDEKTMADSLLSCGGGPAANAAVAVARLGSTAAFAGYLGSDGYGRSHCDEFRREGVLTDYVVRGSAPTPLSVIVVKPGGQRSVIAYRGATPQPPEDAVDLTGCVPRVILVDGHEPHVALAAVRRARQARIPAVLDAGSVHAGTRALAAEVEYLVASERFAHDFTGTDDLQQAAGLLSVHASHVVITRGDRGLIWQTGESAGRLDAFCVTAVDTTGAGDAFHGAFAAALARGAGWQDTLQYASAAGALCCMKPGGRPAMPTAQDVHVFLEHNRKQRLSTQCM